MALVSHLSALDVRLAILVRLVWRMRVAGGVCRLVLAGTSSGLGIVLLDAALDLSVASRCVLEVAWLAILSVATWRFILKPWNDEVSTFEIARRLEAHFPEFGERLLSIVELRDEPDIAPELLDSLARDTQVRTRDLKLQKAFSIRPLVGVAITLAATLALGSSIAGAGERLRRVAVPWYRPAVALHFEIVVTSGDAVVRRGDSVTLTAYLRARDSIIDCPEAAALVVRDAGDDVETSVSMVGVQPGAFHRTLSFVERDFEYRIQAGHATSEWFAVRVADGIELTDRTSVAIVPPSYATNVPANAIPGFTDIVALQFSIANFRFHFDRPAESVVLEWRPEGRNTLEASDPIPLELGPDRTSATATFALRSNGVLRVVLVNETGPRKLRTEMSADVRVVVDAPPSFERIAGLASKPRTVKPGERLAFEFDAADDRGIASAELESSSGAKQPISLSAANAVRATGRAAFAIPPGARDGETFGFRVRVRDARRVNDPKLEPQESVYPAEGWSTFLVSASAPPLDQQEVFGLRDALREGLQTALPEFQEMRTEVELLQADTAGHSPLPIDHGLRLAAIRDRLRKANLPLEAVARELALTPDARGLAATLREIAAHSLRDAEESLQRATTDSAADRTTALDTARKHLLDASTRFEGLLKENERLARDRLDRQRLEALASDQSMLADRAEASTGSELLKRQRELLERLARLVEASDPLKRGIETATANESAKLASETRALVAKLRELDTAAKTLTAEVRKSILDSLADGLTSQLERAEKLEPRYETATDARW